MVDEYNEFDDEEVPSIDEPEDDAGPIIIKGTFLRKGRLKKEVQARLLEGYQEVLNQPQNPVNSPRPFLSLSYDFLRKNEETIIKLERAFTLYIYLLTNSNWADGEKCKWAHLGEWFDAGFIVTVREVKYLAEKFDVSEWTIWHWLNQLEDEGWIRRIPRYTYHNSHTSNVILLGYHFKVQDTLKTKKWKTAFVRLAELKEPKRHLRCIQGGATLDVSKVGTLDVSKVGTLDVSKDI